jgi:hypothetical protein
MLHDLPINRYPETIMAIVDAMKDLAIATMIADNKSAQED